MRRVDQCGDMLCSSITIEAAGRPLLLIRFKASGWSIISLSLATSTFCNAFAHGVRRAQTGGGIARQIAARKTKQRFAFEPCQARLIPPPLARSEAARKMSRQANVYTIDECAL